MGVPRAEMRVSARTLRTGAAWLSSARVVRCWVKSRNERNPRLQLPSGLAGHSEGTAGDKPEEGGDDVKSSWPLCPGLHTCYNGGDSGSQVARPSRSLKAVSVRIALCNSGACRWNR